MVNQMAIYDRLISSKGRNFLSTREQRIGSGPTRNMNCYINGHTEHAATDRLPLFERHCQKADPESTNQAPYGT